MYKVGFGVVGAGFIARVHAEALAGVDRAELRAVYNWSSAQGKALADRFHVPWYNDYDRFLARDDLDAVIGWKGTQQYDGDGTLMNQWIHTIDINSYQEVT